MRPAISTPNVRRQAPVRVATSTTASTGSSTASDSPSAMTRRPSASVLRTSTVFPLRMVRTSPSFIAVPDGMLSVQQRYAVTAVVQPTAWRAVMVARIAAAPVMSFFICAWDSSLGLRLMPPESYMIPLPINASRPVGDGGAYRIRISRGGSALPMLTPRMPRSSSR